MEHADSVSDAPYHCPQCNAKEFKHVMPKKFLCKHCGFELFMNASAAVCALITDDRNRLLVTVRAHQPAQGQLDLPGGFVNPGETAEHAVLREVKEELGLDVETLSYFCSEANTSYAYGGVNYQTLDLAFTCQVRSPSLARAADDVQAVQFVSLEGIELQDFGFISIRKIIQRFCENRQNLQNR
jgi:NAD+ diphosphatase